MPITLKNKLVELIFDLPDENYNQSRFDWTGKITKVFFNSIQITSCETGDYSKVKDIGQGFYNEFGIDSAFGYEETQQDQYFHKLGVGKLFKDDDNYTFYKPYTIVPANFKINNTENSINVECISDNLNAYQYKLNKTIEITEHGFFIQYTLLNMGEKAIVTNEYNHNFVAFNNEPIGSDYEIEFNFDLATDNLEELVNPDKAVDINKNRVTFNSRTKEQFFYTNLLLGKKISPSWKVINTKLKIGVKESVSFKSEKLNLWGWKHVISPEIFYHINLKPGETTQWTRTYNFYNI